MPLMPLICGTPALFMIIVWNEHPVENILITATLIDIKVAFSHMVCWALRVVLHYSCAHCHLVFCIPGQEKNAYVGYEAPISWI